MRFVFLGIGVILAIFHVVGSLPSVDDWLMSLRKRCLVASGAFLIMSSKQYNILEAVSFK